MKKQIIVFGITAAVLVFGIGAFALVQSPSEPDSMMKKEGEVMMKKTEDNMMATSRYVEYSAAALEKAVTGRRVLFFYASWCPTCRPADESFTQNSAKIPEDVTLLRVNYNDPDTDQEEKDLAQKYGITYQHTFIQIDSTGNEVTKWNGGQINELLSNLK
ncbi:MAG: thioredoxin family protein [Patescibacteria group bacterium]|jgi:thiol-disulfide isomerase/thioredoxin